jgi:hypothetical protein
VHVCVWGGVKTVFFFQNQLNVSYILALYL